MGLSTENMAEWCRGKSYSWRAVALLYGVFVLFKAIARPEIFTPIDFLNLAVHEMGHMVFMPFGEWIGIAGGSIMQLAVPVYGVWQFLRQEDYFAASLSVAWLGDSFANLSVYIADARTQQLPLANLFGGDPIHDWNYLLDSMHALASEQRISIIVRFAAVLCALFYLRSGSWLVWRMIKSNNSGAV